jgi:hypothetical protein
MTKKPGNRYEVELDWYYISKENLLKWAVALLLVVVAGVVLYLVLRPKPDSLPRRAARELAAAEELMEKARVLPNAPRVKDELESASSRLEEARTFLKTGSLQEAVKAAQEVQETARRLLSGMASARGDVAILECGGKVEIQRAARATWEPARAGAQLFEGDFIKTGTNGGADVVAADGTMYRIRADTLFEVHRSSVVASGPEEDKRRSEIKFIVGTVDVNTGEGSRSIVRTDAATADIAQRSSVGLDVDQSKSTGLSTYRGQATLSTGESKVTLRERERAVAQAGTGTISAKVRLPETPVLQRPDESAAFDPRKKAPVEMRWSAVKEATRYRLQIANSRLFIPDSLIVDLSDRVRNEATVTVNEEGTFFWRVAALGKGSLSSEWSAPRKFKVQMAQAAGGGSAPEGTGPGLVLQRPQVTGGIVIVTGKADAGASVTVNGESAETDPSGTFRKVISFTKEGLNVVEVRATDGAGSQTVRRENVVIQIY